MENAPNQKGGNGINGQVVPDLAELRGTRVIVSHFFAFQLRTLSEEMVPEGFAHFTGKDINESRTS